MQDGIQLLLQQDEAGRVDRHDRVAVLDEVAEVGVLLLTDRRLQGDRLLGHLEDLTHLVRCEIHFLGDLLRARLTTEVLQELPLDADQLVDRLDHVHRDADGACLVGDGPGDRLPDPPGGVGGELVALGVVELLHRADQTEVALLDEVQEQHAAAHVALGDRHHQPQVRLDELALGDLPVTFDRLQVAAHLRGGLAGGRRELLGGEQAGLDPLGEVDLLLRGQQRDLPDLLEVHAHRVGGRRLERQLLLLTTTPGEQVVLLGVLPTRLENLDALVVEDLQDGVGLLRWQLGRLEGDRDVLGSEETDLLASGDEVLDLVHLGFAR